MKTIIALAFLAALLLRGVAVAHPDPDATKRPCHDEPAKPCRMADLGR